MIGYLYLVSVRAAVENSRGRVEKLCPKESPKDAHTHKRLLLVSCSVSVVFIQ